jgi:hypothetical protein
MIMRQNYFLDLLAVDSPSASSSGNTSSTPVLRTLRTLLSTVQIFSHSGAETASAQCPSRSGVIATLRKIIGFSEQSKPIINYFHKRCAGGLRNGSYVMSWDSQFAEPIVLPNNVVATTLRHVIAYISELPDAERNSREWRNARKHILRAADQVGSTWFARIAIIRALKRRMPRFRRRSWSPEELRLLDKLVVDGASPRTAAEALNRSKETVRTKARRVGCPFPHRDEVKRQRPLTQEEAELPQLAR